MTQLDQRTQGAAGQRQLPPHPSAYLPVHAAQRLDRLPASRWLTKVMVVLFLGWLVESYDIGLSGSVLPSLTHLYHLGTGAESVVSISASAGIVLGIVPAGWLADRFGRKRIMVAGTVAYAVLSFLTGLAPSIGVLIALRVLAGVAMGAVFPLPYAYGAELCPPAIRGRFTGIADSFLSIGYFLSPLLALWLIPSVTNDTGWRVMFFLGGLPIIFAFLAWRYVPESPRWYEARGRFAESEKVLTEIEARVAAEIGRPLPGPPVTRGPGRQGVYGRKLPHSDPGHRNVPHRGVRPAAVGCHRPGVHPAAARRRGRRRRLVAGRRRRAGGRAGRHPVRRGDQGPAPGGHHRHDPGRVPLRPGA